ncbi:MAG: hypothetical protein ABSA39_08285 [Edaphobacter sp.]
MKNYILLAVDAFLFLCISMYLGTGWSLLLFSFPIAPKLTVSTYYLQFVPQVTAATAFFTKMTAAMIAANLVMLVAEWRTKLRWVPIVVLLAVIAATVLTIKLILPLNAIMAQGITDQTQLQDILSRWIMLNKWRVALWTIQWFAMMVYFVVAWCPQYRAPSLRTPSQKN